MQNNNVGIIKRDKENTPNNRFRNPSVEIPQTSNVTNTNNWPSVYNTPRRAPIAAPPTPASVYLPPLYRRYLFKIQC